MVKWVGDQWALPAPNGGSDVIRRSLFGPKDQADIDRSRAEIGRIDSTADLIERAKARLAEVNDLLTEAGSTTVVKSDTL
jgi:hypothetical protein